MVKSYLIGQGVSASRIDTFGRGAQNPLKSNGSPEGRQQNRRVEIKVNSE
jgi:outer membrane protein OmpA-like peptidoglycan-associated protein